MAASDLPQSSTNRWKILAILTLARAAMAIQFQTVAALGPALQGEMALGDAELLWLVGLFLLPGILFALPGGWLAMRLGDKRLVIAGLVLMVVGGLMMIPLGNATQVFVGRTIAGIGGVLINVLVTKMVADWFPGSDGPFAMAILIVSWPAGLALAMVVLPSVAITTGIGTAIALPIALSAICVIAVALGYRSPPGVSAAPAGAVSLNAGEWLRTSLAGGLWGFYNLGLIVLLAVGPVAMVSSGADTITAVAYYSVVSFLLVPTNLAGGWIISRVNRPQVAVAVTLVILIVLVPLLAALGSPLWLLVLCGVLFGIPAPLIMTLPGKSVRPDVRAMGMGVYFTWYYVIMGILPGVAGWVSDSTGNPNAAIWVSSGWIAVALACLLAFLSVTQKRDD